MGHLYRAAAKLSPLAVTGCTSLSTPDWSITRPAWQRNVWTWWKDASPWKDAGLYWE